MDTQASASDSTKTKAVAIGPGTTSDEPTIPTGAGILFHDPLAHRIRLGAEKLRPEPKRANARPKSSPVNNQTARTRTRADALLAVRRDLMRLAENSWT